MFTNISDHLEGARQKKYNDKNGWHNMFWHYITSAIDERKYKPLFAEKMGSPNAPIRILLSMMILKEGFGLSDERLFEVCQFDLLVMKALGINNIDDDLPCPATYYNLKNAIYRHHVEQGEDMVGETFRQLTKNQAKVFGVTGEFARMDSKLMGSNIAKCSRLQLILSVLQVFYKSIKDEDALLCRLDEEERERLTTLSSQKPGQIVYKMDNPSKEEMLEELGYLLLRIMERYSEADSDKYHLITRILSEQYQVKGEKISIKEVKEIQADSLQSPHDEDAAFRNKGGTKVQGYSVNLTETCNEEGLNLVTNVKVEKATAADNDFVPESIEKSQEVVGHIDHLNADGAYHSENNNRYAGKNETDLILSDMQGKKGKYSFEVEAEGTVHPVESDKVSAKFTLKGTPLGQFHRVKVTNTHTGEIFDAEHYKKGKWKIRDNGNIKYFSYAFILSYFNRLRVEDIPRSEKNRRNNVEASIFQLSYFTRNNKTRYRSKYTNQLWAYNRCLWMNMIRIRNYMGEVCPIEPDFNKKVGLLAKNALRYSLLVQMVVLNFFNRNFLQKIFGVLIKDLFICTDCYIGEVSSLLIQHNFKKPF
ncbi:MAG: transposase [Bacteroidetes bacterium]|nr:transposase [Bacteroidota bacterium]